MRLPLLLALLAGCTDPSGTGLYLSHVGDAEPHREAFEVVEPTVYPDGFYLEVWYHPTDIESTASCALAPGPAASFYLEAGGHMRSAVACPGATLTCTLRNRGTVVTRNFTVDCE